jgi:hypothetical protein
MPHDLPVSRHLLLQSCIPLTCTGGLQDAATALTEDAPPNEVDIDTTKPAKLTVFEAVPTGGAIPPVVEE